MSDAEADPPLSLADKLDFIEFFAVSRLLKAAMFRTILGTREAYKGTEVAGHVRRP